MNNDYRKITLNNVDYFFSSVAASTEILSPDQYASGNYTNSLDTKLSLIKFGAFKNISIVDNIFAPFNDLNFIINTPNNGIENQQDFSFKANNRNLFSFLIARSDVHKDIPQNTLKLSYAEKTAMLDYEGIITTSTIIGSPNSSFSMQEFDCDEIVSCLLKEKKIAQIIPAVDNSKPVSQVIADILKLVVDPSLIDEDSFNSCTEVFTSTFVYPVDFSAYDAIMFLLPFCLGKIKGLDTQLFLKYNKIIGKYMLFSPMQALLEFKISERFNLSEQTGIVDQQSQILKNSNGLYLAGNDITSYNFSDVSFNRSNTNYVNIKVTNTTNPTLAGDIGFIKLTQEIDNFSNNILSDLQQLYINGVKLNVPLDVSKIGELNSSSYRVVTGPYDRDQLERIAKSEMYSLFMFENMMLSIVVPGQVYRSPGTFIEVFRQTKGGTFDKKLLGHWYIVEVKHTIDSNGVYVNELLCTKPFIAI